MKKEFVPEYLRLYSYNWYQTYLLDIYFENENENETFLDFLQWELDLFV